MDDIPGADHVAFLLCSEDAATLDAVQHLRYFMGVQVGAGARTEAHDDDVDAFARSNERLDADRAADEEVGAAVDGSLG
jgi:hypothetical protein